MAWGKHTNAFRLQSLRMSREGPELSASGLGPSAMRDPSRAHDAVVDGRNATARSARCGSARPSLFKGGGPQRLPGFYLPQPVRRRPQSTVMPETSTS